MYLLYVLPVFLSYFAFCFVAAVVVVVASLLFIVSFIFPDAVHYLLLTCIVCVVCCVFEHEHALPLRRYTLYKKHFYARILL